MNLIDHTPIFLPNDQADMIPANVYATGRLDKPYKLFILSPTVNRIIDEFDDESIVALWAEQYPEWAKKIAPVI